MSGPTRSAAIFSLAAQNRTLVLCLLVSLALHLCALLLPGVHPPTLVTLPVLTARLEPTAAPAPALRRRGTRGLSGSAAPHPKVALPPEPKPASVRSKPKASIAKPVPLPLKPAPPSEAKPVRPVAKRVPPARKNVAVLSHLLRRPAKPEVRNAKRAPIAPTPIPVPIRPVPKPRAPQVLARARAATELRRSAEPASAAPMAAAKSAVEASARVAPVSEPAAPISEGTSAEGNSAERSEPGAAAASPEDHIDAAALDRYRLAVIASARHYRRYPATAVDNGWQGRVIVDLAIGANGMMQGTRIQSSSGYEILDRQALDMVRKAKPLTPIPRELRGRAFSVDIPVIFNLQAG